MDVCFAHLLAISAYIANGQWLLLFCNSDSWFECPSGLFIRGLTRWRMGGSWLNNINSIICCHPKNVTPVHYHCYTKLYVLPSALFVSCDADYYLAGIHGHNKYGASGRIKCCKFVPPGMVDMNSLFPSNQFLNSHAVCLSKTAPNWIKKKKKD